MPVHVFSLAEQAYRTMRRAQTSRSTAASEKQIIILSGQSGAGKVRHAPCNGARPSFSP